MCPFLPVSEWTIKHECSMSENTKAGFSAHQFSQTSSSVSAPGQGINPRRAPVTQSKLLKSPSFSVCHFTVSCPLCFRRSDTWALCETAVMSPKNMKPVKPESKINKLIGSFFLGWYNLLFIRLKVLLLTVVASKGFSNPVGVVDTLDKYKS